jgi:hypothetical protein
MKLCGGRTKVISDVEHIDVGHNRCTVRIFNSM